MFSSLRDFSREDFCLLFPSSDQQSIVMGNVVYPRSG